MDKEIAGKLKSGHWSSHLGLKILVSLCRGFSSRAECEWAPLDCLRDYVKTESLRNCRRIAHTQAECEQPDPNLVIREDRGSQELSLGHEPGEEIRGPG